MEEYDDPAEVTVDGLLLHEGVTSRLLTKEFAAQVEHVRTFRKKLRMLEDNLIYRPATAVFDGIESNDIVVVGRNLPVACRVISVTDQGLCCSGDLGSTTRQAYMLKTRSEVLMHWPHFGGRESPVEVPGAWSHYRRRDISVSYSNVPDRGNCPLCVVPVPIDLDVALVRREANQAVRDPADVNQWSCSAGHRFTEREMSLFLFGKDPVVSVPSGPFKVGDRVETVAPGVGMHAGNKWRVEDVSAPRVSIVTGLPVYRVRNNGLDRTVLVQHDSLRLVQSGATWNEPVRF